MRVSIHIFPIIAPYMRHLAALFDLDGVIIDTETGYTSFWAEVDRRYPTGIDDFTHKVKGTNLGHILSHFKDASTRQLVLEELRDYEDSMPYLIFPEALRFLGELRSARIPCALVTSSGKRKLDQIASIHPTLFGYFDALVTGEMVTRTKPDPECFVMGARMLGMKPEDCVVFEDSMNGVAAGVASGAKVVALTTTFPESIKTTKADRFIESFAGFGLSQLYNMFPVD